MSSLESIIRTATLAAMIGLGATTLGSTIGCGGAPEESESEATSEDVLQRGTGSSTKTKGDLEADGYTCSALEGTTVTLCWKNGAPSYSCDPQGRCIQNLTKGRQTLHPPVRRAVRAF